MHQSVSQSIYVISCPPLIFPNFSVSWHGSQDSKQPGLQAPRTPCSQDSKQPGLQAARTPSTQDSMQPGLQAPRTPSSQDSKQPGLHAARTPSSRDSKQPGLTNPSSFLRPIIGGQKVTASATSCGAIFASSFDLFMKVARFWTTVSDAPRFCAPNFWRKLRWWCIADLQKDCMAGREIFFFFFISDSFPFFRTLPAYLEWLIGRSFSYHSFHNNSLVFFYKLPYKW